MKFKIYLNRCKYVIIHFFIVLIILNLVLISSSELVNSIYDILYLNLLILCVSLFFIVFRYKMWKSQYKEFYETLNKEENIDLILPKGTVFEAKLINDTVKLKNKEIYENTKKLKEQIDELNDYITKWVHEIKIPISICELIADRIEDNFDVPSDIPNSLRREYERTKFLVEQVLYAGRASSYSENLLINEVNLNKVINGAVKKNAYLFISKKIDLNLKNLNFNVMTDEKWISYMIEQIINNACKYVNENGAVKIYCTEDEKTVKLAIRDNGAGILPKDLNRVFDKGFTGNNGRKTAKSTGMGLYFSKKMAKKLNHDIKVTSKFGEYTEFTVIFYKLSDYFVLQ